MDFPLLELCCLWLPAQRPPGLLQPAWEGAGSRGAESMGVSNCIDL